MRFSMNSYLLGVGTVVGALAFGFGGGILLTKTAIKDTPTGPSRIERVARQEPPPAAPPVQVTEARPVPVPRPDPAPAAHPTPEPAPVQAAAEPNPETKPVAEAARPEPAKAAEPVRQMEASRQAERPPEPVKQADAPKQIEQREAAQEITAREQRRAEREQRRAERRIARERYYADRKARAVEYARVRQRPIEIQEQPARRELAFEREEPRQPNLFVGLFGRPAEAAPGERD